MNKLLKSIVAATIGVAMAIGAGVGLGREAKAVHAEASATMAAGTNGSTAVVVADGVNNDAIKVGTSSKGGDMTIKVPAGAAKLCFYAAAWNGVSGLSLNITPATTPSSVALTADSGIANSSPFTLSGNAASFKHEVALSNITVETTFTLASSIAKRFVVWGASYKTSGESTPTTYTITYKDGGATSGSVPVDDNEYESGANATVLGNTNNLVRDGYTFSGWSDGEKTYQPGNPITIGSKNIELTAVWSVVIDSGADHLDRSFTGVTDGATSYSSWNGKTGDSGAVYAGNSAGSNDSIQLRSKDNSGIISTTSGGNIKKVIVVWESNTLAGRTLNVYGKNEAYSSTSELYNDTTQGDLLGTIVKGSSNLLIIDDSYRYVGVRSDDGAMYLSSIYFKWGAASLEPRVSLNPDSLVLRTNQTKSVNVTALVEDVAEPTYEWTTNNSNVVLTNTNSATVTVSPNTQVASSSVITLTVGGVTPNLTKALEVTIRLPGTGEKADDPFTVTQAISAIDNAADHKLDEVYVSGIVSKVGTYDSTNKELSYWISYDGTENNQLEIYKGKGLNGADISSAGDIVVGKEVVVFGDLTKFYSTHEFAEGSKLISYNNPSPEHFLSKATAIATIRGEEQSSLSENPTEVTKTVDELFTANNWVTGGGENCYPTFDLDNNITVSTTGSANCGGIFGSNPHDWRLYQNLNGNVIIVANFGSELASITLTFSASNGGVLLNGSDKVTSGTAIVASGKQLELNVGNSGTATNGQIRITAFKVTYKEAVFDSIKSLDLRFGIKIPKADWDAVEGIDDYGVMMFLTTADKLSSVPTVASRYDKNLDFNSQTLVSVGHKNSGSAPDEDGNGNYNFTVKVNIPSVSWYDYYFCVRPFVQIDGEIYWLLQEDMHKSVRTMADGDNSGTNFSPDAINYLKTAH